MDFDVWAPTPNQNGYKQGFSTYKNSWQSCENTHVMQRNTKYMMEILSLGVALCMFLIQRASSLVREKDFLALFSSHDWVVVSTNFALPISANQFCMVALSCRLCNTMPASGDVL